MLTLGELRKHIKDLPDSTVVSTAEEDELEAFNISSVDEIDGAKVRSRKADNTPGIELDGGKQKAIVLRT